MDTAERAAVRHALDSLKPYLAAFLAQRGVVVASDARGPSKAASPDIQAHLKACLASWETTLRRDLPSAARSYIHELIDIRNRWAHEEPFTTREAARAADTVQHLTLLLGAPVATAAPITAKVARTAGGRRETQREVMRRLFVASGRNPDRAVHAYAAAERAGEVVRRSNKHGISAEDYARALLADGEKKGWLREDGG